MTTVEEVPVQLLKQVPIFSACSEEALALLAAVLQPQQMSAGEIIFSEGDQGDELYIIASGHARVVSDVHTEKIVFAHLGPGEFFGEMALITGEQRSAGVIAATDAKLWRLRKADFQAILKQHPEISIEMTRIQGERVRRGNVQRFENEAFTFLTLTPERQEITIGRLPENDLVINDPQVAGVHARVRNTDGHWVIYDEGSETGTYVNRRRVKVAELQDGDEILIAANKIFLDGIQVKGFRGREGIRIDALNLSKELKDGRRILNDISLSIAPGEFVAVVGGSGAGKTSLLHALNGFSPGTSGAVRYNGTDLYENQGLFRTVLGYVPQDDIVHGELTVERTLYYTAKLRLPKDTSTAELDERIGEVLEAVGLAQHRKTEVRRLSGGQRKRTSVAIELLARPRALYLDEPTSGLDPSLEGRMMTLFRDLSDSGTTVVMSTHVTQNLRMCDRLAWMAPGGHLVFFGSPPEALRHFGVQDFGEIYGLLETPEERERWSATFLDSVAYRVNVKERLAPESATAVETEESEEGSESHREVEPSKKQSPLRQWFWLTARYAETLVRDVPNMALLVVQAPVIALAVLLLFNSDIFGATTEEGGDAFRALMSLHILTTAAIFLGSSNAAREITKESAIYSRERLVNLAVVPYVMSKVVVLSLLCLFQAAALVGIFALAVDLPGSDLELYPKLFSAVLLTQLAGLSMGLLVSALSANSDRAMAIVPVLLIPQLIFAGALVPLDHMLAPAKVISQFMISKWALQLAGSLTDLSERFVAQFPSVFAEPYRNELDPIVWLPWVVLAAFTTIMLLATILVQLRKDVH